MIRNDMPSLGIRCKASLYGTDGVHTVLIIGRPLFTHSKTTFCHQTPSLRWILWRRQTVVNDNTAGHKLSSLAFYPGTERHLNEHQCLVRSKRQMIAALCVMSDKSTRNQIV